MLFNSYSFLIFFIVNVILYFSLPYRFRWILLLISSYYFYGSWKAEYLILIIASTAIAYVTALLMDAARSLLRKKLYLGINLFFNLAMLIGFKYANFLGDSVRELLGAFCIPIDIPHLNILLPVGISFFTFQTLSYTIDVYRQKTPVEKHFGIFAVYVAFFPQLVAGPIERSNNLLPQFRQNRDISYSNFRYGLEWAMWGLFKKVAIADSLATVVNTVYTSPQSHSGVVLLLATVFFAVQIYCDFSGYSDIAIGAAKILGYDLMVNFRQPYLSKSISEFWQRWHISLSTWFCDYMYIPLGGNRVSIPRWSINIMIVFVVSGLWHGANWTFIIWGLLHGFYLLAGALTKSWRGKLAGFLRLDRLGWGLDLCRMLFVFILVLAGWVFFRAQSVKDALYILSHMLSYEGFAVSEIWTLGIPRFQMMTAFVLIGVLFCVDTILARGISLKQYIWNRVPLRYACYCMCFYGIVFFGIFGKVEFIYFQF